MTNDEVIKDMQRMQSGMRIQKVVATRSLKGRYGDTLLGFSAEWDSIQQDGTMGLEDVGDPTQGGLNAVDSQKAALLLGLQCDRAAYLNAAAGGNMDKAQAITAIKALTEGYMSQYKALCERTEQRSK